MQQYWTGDKTWRFVPVDAFSQALAKSSAGQANAATLSQPFNREAPGAKSALAHDHYHLTGTPTCSLRH